MIAFNVVVFPRAVGPHERGGGGWWGFYGDVAQYRRVSYRD
jgi:hypothetical protein